MEQLLQKLMISKQIMDKHNSMERGNHSNSSVSLQNFDTPPARYNIPEEFISNTQAATPQTPSSSAPPTVDAIKKSKLPDEIKRLMIEHPIQKAQSPTTTLSDDLIEKASRLMKEQNNNYVPESAKPKTNQQKVSSIDTVNIRAIVKEAIEESLREHGLLSESSEKTNEVFSFKVGKHVFEGKVTKIKKLS